VTQILGRLVHPFDFLDLVFGGTDKMIESPAFIDFEIEVMRRTIIEMLEGRFGSMPEDILTPLRRLQNLQAMHALARKAGACADLKEFKRSLVRYKSNHT
jgi:hypothetical protein